MKSNHVGQAQGAVRVVAGCSLFLSIVRRLKQHSDLEPTSYGERAEYDGEPVWQRLPKTTPVCGFDARTLAGPTLPYQTLKSLRIGRRPDWTACLLLGELMNRAKEHQSLSFKASKVWTTLLLTVEPQDLVNALHRLERRGLISWAAINDTLAIELEPTNLVPFLKGERKTVNS